VLRAEKYHSSFAGLRAAIAGEIRLPQAALTITQAHFRPKRRAAPAAFRSPYDVRFSPEPFCFLLHFSIRCRGGTYRGGGFDSLPLGKPPLRSKDTGRLACGRGGPRAPLGAVCVWRCSHDHRRKTLSLVWSAPMPKCATWLVWIPDEIETKQLVKHVGNAPRI
jgi:hypothetical protein